MNTKSVNTKIQTIEDYMRAIVVSVISIRTIIAFGESAAAAGILEDDELQIVVELRWNLQRCAQRLNDQLQNLQERSSVTADDLIQRMSALDAKPRRTRKPKNVDDAKPV